MNINVDYNVAGKVDMHSSLAEELASNEYEFESLISDLCIELDKNDLATITLAIKNYTKKMTANPTLAYLLTEFPYIASNLNTESEFNYSLELDPEFDNTEISFNKEARTDLLHISFTSGNNIIKTDISIKELMIITKRLILTFSSAIENIDHEVSSHRLFQAWLNSEYVKTAIN